MSNVHRTAAPQACGTLRAAGQHSAGTDLARAPIVFGWLLYRQDRFAGAVHLETLYRLDRVGGSAAEAPASLQPSPYFGQSIEMLRALLRAQQHTRLPQGPPGCRWLGPHLVTEVNAASSLAMRFAPAPASADAWPAGRSARLAIASAIARRLLHGTEGA